MLTLMTPASPVTERFAVSFGKAFCLRNMQTHLYPCLAAIFSRIFLEQAAACTFALFFISFLSLSLSLSLVSSVQYSNIAYQRMSQPELCHHRQKARTGFIVIVLPITIWNVPVKNTAWKQQHQPGYWKQYSFGLCSRAHCSLQMNFVYAKIIYNAKKNTIFTSVKYYLQKSLLPVLIWLFSFVWFFFSSGECILRKWPFGVICFAKLLLLLLVFFLVLCLRSIFLVCKFSRTSSVAYREKEGPF